MPNSQSSANSQPRRTLILTGASRGIGHATVKRFSAAGWRVITCSRHPFPENCPWEMGPEDHIQVDLANPANTAQAIDEIKRRLVDGELHALVNNAAISPKADGGKRMGSIETTIDVWQQVFQVNFFAPIMLARGLLDQLAATKGSVVNVTSIAGSRVHPFAGTAYSTSKAALAALTREMASDFGPRGIRVNAISAGPVKTLAASGIGDFRYILRWNELNSPLRRNVTIDQVGASGLYLLSDMGAGVTGEVHHVDSGYHTVGMVAVDAAAETAGLLQGLKKS